MAHMEYSDGDRASSSPLFSLFGTAVMIPYLTLSGVLVAIVLYFSNVLPAQYVLEKVNDVISKVINFFLQHRYPILHQRTGQSIPTCPYRWPNGQGDVGKFLEGIENSDLWGKKHGHIYRIWAGMKPEIVLQKSEHVRFVFRDSHQHVKAVNNDSGYLMGEVLGKCLGLVSGQEWRSLRSVSETAFRHDRAMIHLDLIHRRVRTFLEANENLRQGIVDPVEDFEFLPFLIVADLLYGGLSPDMEYRLRRMASGRKRLFQYVIQGGLSRYSWSKYLPTAANHRLAEFRTQWIAFNQDAYCRARQQQTIETPIVQLFQAAESGRISVENVYQTLDETLFANLDVTVGAMSWNLVFLAAHPDVQDELYADITAAGAREGERVEQFLQSSSTLLAACISESARLKPLAAFSVPQSAPTERLLDGFVIPAGTNFIVDAYALNLRDEFWGLDRHVYRPRRFQELNLTESRYHLWRFGFGPRQCLGKYVADLIMRTLLMYLIREWTLGFPDREGANPENWKRDMETWITHPMIKLTCERRG